MPLLAAAACIAGGIVLVAISWGSVFRTLVVPRGLTSRLAVGIGRCTQAFFHWLSNRLNTYEAKDRILAAQAPMTLLAMLLVWLGLFLIGFSLILWPLIDLSFAAAIREAGSSLLTLGFASTSGAAPTAVYLFAAVTGLLVVALEIAYLPVLYSAFNRRETVVTMLQSRAGAPAWGPEILARHQLVGILDRLPELYSEWERWAADVAESHSNYPVLVSFRSPHPLRSWIVGLLAVLDSAAMYLALSPARAPSEARLCIRMGFTCLRDIATTLRVPFDPDPLPDDPIELTFEQFAGGVARLEEVGFPMERSPEEAWPHFKGWRVNYEAVAYEIADLVVAAPGPWSGTRSHLPGLMVVPERPADRRPDDHRTDSIPKATTRGWRA